MDKSALKARYPEAFAYLEARGVVPSDAFYSQLERLRQRSFTIAKLAQIEQIQRAKDSLVKAAQDGLSFDEWRKITTPEMLALPKSYQETVFRNAVLSAHNAGKWAHFRDNAERRPILRYSAVNDSRTRPAHRALHGLMMPIDDPRWQAIAPSNGHNCRCTLMSLSERQAKAFGYEGAPAQLPTYKDKHGHDVEAHADAGWVHSPEHDLTDYLREKEKKAGLPEAVFDSGKDNKASGYTPPEPPPNDPIAKICYDIVTKGQADGVEYAAVLGADAELLAMVKGEKDKVSLKHILDNEPNAKSVYHNHPSGASLSLEDLQVSSLFNVEVTALATYSEGEYQARVLSSFAEFEAYYPEAKKRAKALLQKQHKAGGISVGEADILFPHLINYLLQKQGVIEYNVKKSPPLLKQALSKIDLSNL